MAEPGAISIVVPAHNEAEAVGRVVAGLRAAARWREILVVDDGSTDGTGEAARAAGAQVITHPYRMGNGAAVKSGIRRASGDYVLIVDADGQHRPADATRIAARLGDFDLVIGARTAGTQASPARRLGNALLNRLAGYLTGRPIPDLTSGFRGARRDGLLECLHLLPNGFSTPTTTTLSFIKAGYSVGFEAIEAEARTGRSKIRLGPDGFKFFLILLKIVTIYSPLRIFVPISLLMFAGGASYGLWTVLTQSHLTNTSVLLILLSVVIFLFGLVSEQIAALRTEGRR
ncbi:MAG: glycosyltransferase family 2 protein [Acidobacteriota bacterium]|nr:glycosyltransferase family 2 protein [Acidobacteriota bacterium]